MLVDGPGANGDHLPWATPSWIASGLRHFRDETLLYLRTVYAFVFHPHRSAAGWANHTIETTSPLRYLLDTLVLTSAWGGFWASRFGLPEQSLTKIIAENVLPQVFSFGAGTVAHALFRVTGSKCWMKSLRLTQDPRLHAATTVQSIVLWLTVVMLLGAQGAAFAGLHRTSRVKGVAIATASLVSFMILLVVLAKATHLYGYLRNP